MELLAQPPPFVSNGDMISVEASRIFFSIMNNPVLNSALAVSVWRSRDPQGARGSSTVKIANQSFFKLHDLSASSLPRGTVVQPLCPLFSSPETAALAQASIELLFSAVDALHRLDVSRFRCLTLRITPLGRQRLVHSEVVAIVSGGRLAEYIAVGSELPLPTADADRASLLRYVIAQQSGFSRPLPLPPRTASPSTVSPRLHAPAVNEAREAPAPAPAPASAPAPPTTRQGTQRPRWKRKVAWKQMDVYQCKSCASIYATKTTRLLGERVCSKCRSRSSDESD